MFAEILDCPECSHRFHYDHTGSIPARISCPNCGLEAAAEEFSAIILCPECNKKIKIPLDLLNDPEICCPCCDTHIRTNNALTEDGDYGSTLVFQSQKKQHSSRLKPGDVFDKYKIVRLLGKGGMAEVYLAEHILLKQKCAIKLMQKGLETEDPVFVKRFIREAKLTHSFNHPNIVRVFDAGSEFKTGYLFLAMEYVEGESLSELAKHKTFTETELLEIISSISQALLALHEAGVVHRDIKPSNIMKTQEGVYKLMDLGIAKMDSSAAEGELTLTMEQSTIGTPGYASPEQCHSAHDTDIRSDIYCLGATIYHLASGVLPFDGDTPMEIVLKVLQQEPEPLKKYRPDLSLKTLLLIEKMMKKNPEERPASPEKLLEEIYTKNKFSETFKLFAANFLKKCFIPAFRKVKSHSLFLPILKSLLKYTFILALLVAIIIPGTYLYRYTKSEKNRFISFQNFLTRLFDLNSEDPRPVALPSSNYRQQRFQQTQYIPVHPDFQNVSYRKTQKNPDGTSTILYPQVDFSKLEKGNVVFDTTFAKVLKSTSSVEISLPETWFKNSVLHVKDTPPEILRETKSGKKIYKTVSRHHVRIKNYSMKNYTISADLCIDSGDPALLMTIAGNIRLEIQNKKLMLFVTHGRMQRELLPEIPFGKWFNLTISVSKSEERLSVFSGSCFLGAYQLKNAVFFYYPEIELNRQYSSSPPLFSGKIARLTVYGESWGPNLPGFSRSAVAPICFSDEPVLNTNHQVQTISRRLQKVQQRYEKIKKTDLPYRHQASAYLELQIKKLMEQNHLKQQIEIFSNKNYSYAATEKFKQKFEKYLKTHNNVRSIENRKTCRKLINLLNQPDVNPNIMISPPRKTGREIPLIDAVIDHIPFPDNKNEFLDILLNKHVDVNKCWNSGVPLKVLQAGKDDVDGLSPGYVFEMTGKKNNSQFGTFYKTGDLKQLLYLAPQIDRRDANGRTLMHFAAEANDPELVEHLIYAGISCGTAPDQQNMTPWQIAMTRGSIHVLETMREMQLETSHTEAMQRQLDFVVALTSKNYTRAEQLLKEGADPYKNWFNGLNAMQNACAANDQSAVKMLLRNKVDPNRYTMPRRTEQHEHPLYIAALCGNPEILRLLLQNGADSEFSDFTSWGNSADTAQTIISRMRFDRNCDTIFQLLDVLTKHDKNWNINKRYANGSTLLSLCAFTYGTPPGNGPDVRKILCKYLIKNGAKWEEYAHRPYIKTIQQDNTPEPGIQQVIPATDWTKFFKPADKLTTVSAEKKVNGILTYIQQQVQNFSKLKSKYTSQISAAASATSQITPELPYTAPGDSPQNHETVPSHAEKTQRTIAVRLQERQEYLKKLKQLPYSDLNREHKKYVEHQISILQTQLKIRDKVKKASRNAYDSRANSDFKTAAEAYLAKTWRYSLAERKESAENVLKKLQKITDPNITIYDYTRKKQVRLPALTHRFSWQSHKKFMNIVRNLHVDINLSKPEEISSDDLFFFGKEDVDSNNNYPAARFLSRYSYPPGGKYFAGHRFDSRKLRQFLLLAPQMDNFKLNGRNLMHIAAEINDPALIKDLYFSGFTRGKEKDSRNLTPWQVAMMYGSTQALKALEKVNLQTTIKPQQQIQYDFWQSIQQKNLEKTKKLIMQGADINQTCFNGLNALQYACSLNDLATVEYLINGGASLTIYPKKYNSFFYNPLQIAVANGNSRMLAFLLKHSISGSSYHRYNRYHDLFSTILSRLYYDENAHVILKLLRVQMKYDKSWHINSMKNNQSYLYRCAIQHSRDNKTKKQILQFLIKAGASQQISSSQYNSLPVDFRDFFTTK